MSIDRWKAVRSRIRSHRKLFPEGSPDGIRLSRLIGRVGHHINLLGEKIPPKYDLNKLSGVRYVHDAMIRGDKIVVFDAEWPYDANHPRFMNEIGLVVIEDGRETFHNIHIDGFKGGAKSYRGTAYPTELFRHGETLRMDAHEARQWLSYQVNDARVVVGHALVNDRRQLRKWGWAFDQRQKFADTACWSEQMYGQMVKLHLLARRLGVMTGHDFQSLHCAGNDAALTWAVAQKIVHNAMENHHAITV